MRFGGLIAIDDLSFDARKGDITAIIGPNGAGKTTVFNCITGFYKPTEGRIALVHGDDAVLSRCRSRHHRPGSNGSRPPDGALFLLERMQDHQVSQHRARRPHLPEHPPVRRHDAARKPADRPAQQADGGLGLYVSRPCRPRRLRPAERDAIDKARYWLEKTGLIDRADDPAASLPYGAQRRLEIARAMCSDPVLLCLDEPAAGLNAREGDELNELLLAIRKEHDTSILLIEHDMGVVMEISDRIVVLDYGRKISDGTPERRAQRSEGHRRLSRRRGRRDRAVVAEEISV